jgi:hypothetical protein
MMMMLFLMVMRQVTAIMTMVLNLMVVLMVMLMMHAGAPSEQPGPSNPAASQVQGPAGPQPQQASAAGGQAPQAGASAGPSETLRAVKEGARFGRRSIITLDQLLERTLAVAQPLGPLEISHTIR